jgi:hypothetical protein
VLFLIAFIGAAVIAVVLWKALNTTARSEAASQQQPQRRTPAPPTPPRVSGPDDDPDFLRQLDEKVRRRDEPPSA